MATAPKRSPFTYKRIDDIIPRTKLILSDVIEVSMIPQTKHSITRIITKNTSCSIYTETEGKNREDL